MSKKSFAGLVCLIMGTLPGIASQTESPQRKTVVTIGGDAFWINGQPTYAGRRWQGHKVEGLLFNSRMVNGIFDDLNPDTRVRWAYPDTGKWDPERNTLEFVAAMPSWHSHGLLAFTINLQGGSPQGYSKDQPWHNSALTEAGELRPEFMKRLERILDQADELGMVVILGLFYQGQDERLKDEAAVVHAVDNAVAWVLEGGYRNVLIEVNNECNTSYQHAILRPDRVHELIERVKQQTRAGRRLLASTSYGGGRVPDENVVKAADFLLLHGNGVGNPDRIAEMIFQTRKVPGYRPMPILFNEDDHYAFDQPRNNLLAALEGYVSWGYFDYRMKGEGFDDGYQSIPANWSISSPRKRSFFAKVLAMTQRTGADTTQPANTRPRIIILTDLSNEPDDEESLVRFLVYANEFDVEGMIATTSAHLKKGPREDLMRRDIDAYAKVLPNLSKHAPGFPSAHHLRAVTRTGQTEYGMDAVGEGKSTAGSRHIIEVVDKADERPVWVSIWGGANTLAQALWDVKATRDQAAVDRFLSKLRVYTISDQDNGGHWIRPQFPKLFYIVAPSVVGGADYWKATWTGISGDVRYQTGVMHRFAMVDNPWLLENIRQNHGPLGELYPYALHIMEGDTPSFLGLINNGLGWHVRPDYGGWGGRYQEFQPWGETRRIWTETRQSRDTVTSDDNGRTETSNQATIWRWREHYQNDFAARMDWCIADDFKKANHNPVAVLNGDKTRNVVEITARPGETVPLPAAGTSDPDGNAALPRWWIYEEAGTLWDQKTRRFPAGVKLTADTGPMTSLTAPNVEKPATIHVILEVRDNGTPRLWAYRRAIVTVEPAAAAAPSR